MKKNDYTREFTSAQYNNMDLFKDENGDLVKCIEYNKNGDFIFQYELNGRELTQIRKDEYNNIQKAKILYSEDCYLFHIILGGENSVRVFKKDSSSKSPNRQSYIYQRNNNLFEYYTVKQSLIDEWSKKLNG